MIIILFFSSNEIIRQIKSDSNNDNNILTEYSDSFLDLYNLYYVLESKKLINDLSNDELTNVKKEIGNYPIELVIERGNLYDLWRSEEHTSELQSRGHLVCRLLLEKKKKKRNER